MAEDLTKSKLVYHVWDKDNNEYDIPDDVVQERGMDNFAKDFEGGYITMFDNDKQKVDVPIEDVGEYRNQGYLWYDASGNATPINEVGKKPSSNQKEQTQYPQEVLDAYNSPDNKPGNFKDLAQLNDEYQRGVLKKPGIISQALGMFSNVDAGNIGKEQKVGGMIANMLLGDNMQQSQDNNQQVQHPNQENASATEQPKPTVKDVDAITGAAPVQQVDAIYNKYVGKGDALSETMYDLMASGQAQNQEEAQSMAMGAMNRAANRLAQRTTDEFVSKLGDTVEGVDEAVMNGWHSHAVQDKLKKLASQYGIMNNVAVDENGRYITQTNGYDQFINGMVKPAMVESLVKKYGENYRKTAEDLATRLYSNDEVIQNQLMNQDINAALVDVIGKYVNPSVVEEYNKAQEAGSKAFNEGMEGSQFIPANLRLGTALGAQYEANEAKDPAKVLSSLQKKFGNLYRNPEFLNDMSNAAFRVMQRYGLNGTQSSDPKQFKPMINSVLKNELDQLEIKGMMPKGSAEYIMKTGLGNTIVGKITRKAMQTDYQNWLEDIANQQYQPGFWENVASGALTFAGDAWSYWLPGAAGGKLTKSMIAKAEGKLAGDLMAKGMERKVAERAAKVLIGKSKDVALKNGAVHGAVTFGGQSAISKPIDEVYRTGQFDENGKIYNPSVGKIIANTLGEVAKQSAVGAIMQGGTIANMVGKGRGLATNILADIGGKVVDSGIMTGQQLLDRMAQDPNFKPTGKEAVETFLESGANLLSIGFPGFVGKYARFKNAREFNKKFDFTDQDIAELKRFGYDGLRDAFEKVGIGQYAVVGENAQRLDGQLTQKYMNLMNDKSVPEVLKAKMMAVVEGKRPSSFSPVVDSVIVQPMDNGGKVYLETLNKDGGIIERKEYSSLDEAQKADKKLEYEKTLGLASVLEGEFHNEFTQEHLDGLYNQAAQKYNMGEKLTDEDKAAVYLHQNAGAIKEIMDKQQKGIILTEEEQKQVDTYRHFYNSALENSSVMREFVNTFEDSHGVARGTLRKALESKDKKYAPLVESYLKELYNSIELKREMKQTMDDLYNTAHGNEQKRIEQSGIEGEKLAAPVEGAASVEGVAPVEGTSSSSSDGATGGQEPPVLAGPAPYQDRTNSVPSPSDANSAANVANSSAEVAASDAFVMGQNAYKNGDSGALKAIDYNSDLATGRLKRAFKDSDNMFDLVTKVYNEGRDMEQFVAQRAGNLTPAQKDAIGKYVEAMDAKKGAIDALQHADDGYGEALKSQLWPYQTEDGNIVPATLTSGKQVFLKKANEYGGGFVVVPDEQGQPTIKQVSNAEIKEVGTPVSLDEYIESSLTQQKEARNKQFISQFDGSGLKPNDRVTVAMEEGDANIDMTFAGYSEDGKIVLSDGKDYLPLSKEEFAAWRTNALNNTINERLDREDEEREQKAVSQAEADKKQRYANGIVGLSEGQPDYSSKDTDAKVAADYLQEQYGEDHGKLLNLVNGSRDDIKMQLDNKKKAAAEYQNWLDTNADLDPEKAKKVEDELSLVNEQIADLDARFKNWNTIRNSVMTPDEVKAMTEERKAEVEKAGVDETAIVPSDDFHVLVLDDKELKKQYPTMDKASDYITSQRKDIYHTQEDVERKINDVNDMLEQYINGETELDPTQLMELNTTKAQLEALQTNLLVAAKGLKAQANKLSKLYKTEVSQQEMEELGMTPSEQRKVLVSDAIKKNDLGAIKEIYKDASVDVTDLTPQTLEEAVSESLSPHSLNPESLQYELGKSNFKFGIGKRYDSNKFNYLIAKKGTGMSVNEFAVRVYNDLPVNLQDMGYTDQDVRNALLDMFKSYDSVKEMRNVALMNRIAAAEDELSSEEEFYEAQKEREIIERQAENPDYYAYLEDNSVPLPSENELNHIAGMEYDHMMEIEEREREYKQYVKSILPELADYDDRSNEEGYGGGSSLGSDSSRRGVDEGNRNRQEGGSREASAETETGALHNSTGEGRQEISSLASGEGSADRTPHLPQEASFGERLKNAIAETEPSPSEAQKKAGNYKKGHLSFGGYDFTVETPKGTTRSGKDEQGKPWSVTMHDTYGYILGKIGVDGDHIDMFINDAADLDTFDGNVYVVDQVNTETGEFDEHKVMFGYPSEEAATEAYLANYSKDWKGLGKVTAVPKATFDKWLESSDRKTKPFADYAMVQKEQAKFDRDVKEVKPSEMTEAQKLAYNAVSTMLKKAGIPVKVVSNEDMEKVAEAQDNLNLAMLLNRPEMRFKIKTPEEKQAAENAYNFAKDLRPNKWAQYAVVDMSNPNKMPEYYQKQELARKERTYLNRLMWGNYKVFNLDKSFEDNVAGLTGSFPSEFDPYKIDAQTSKKNELKKQIKETEEAYKSTGQERKEYQNQLMKEYMDEYGLASENDIPDDVWRDFDNKAHEKYQDKLDSLFAKYKDLDRQLKAIVQPGVRFLRTYHGSGANFSEFDFNHMGEGEGTQSFGWGGYVTSSPEIGKYYAESGRKDKYFVYNGEKLDWRHMSATLSGIVGMDGVSKADNFLVNVDRMGVEKAKQKLKDSIDEYQKLYKENQGDFYKKQIDVMKKLLDLNLSVETPKTSLYEVDIPDDNGSNYLDWDAPITDELIDKVAKALPSLSSFDIKDLKKDRTFYNFYKTISMRSVKDDATFNDDKAASKLLASLGYTGIKYKAGRNFGGAEDGDTNYVIFKPEDMKIVDHTKFAQGKGVVYGYTDGKEIVLNQEHLNPNTPIHEYQHLWRTAAKNMNPELIEHGDKLIMQTQLFADLKQDPNYKHLSDDEICDEAFARLTGEDGAAILEQMAKDAIKENPLDTAKELTIINRLKDWLKKFWYWTLDTFTKWKPEDIKKMTLEDIRNLVLRDLANGVDPRAVINRKNDKTMFGMHNISIDKLRKAIKQGGFAAPSMGVVDSKNGIYSDYGEITLIPKAEKLAKRTGKNAGTFTADAWTPTYPQVERIMNKQGEKAFNTDMNEKLGDVDNGIYSNIRESWKGYLSSGDVRDGLYWHYLFDKGLNPETIYQTGKYDNDITNEVMRISDNGNKTDYTDEEVAELIQLMNKATGKDNDIDAQREKLKARIASAEKQGNHLLVALKKKRLAELEGVENFYIAADFVNDVVRNNRKNGKVDVYDTMSAAKKKVEDDKKLSTDFPSWLDKKTEKYGVEEMLYNGTTPSGKPKYIPNTIENAVKLMKKQGVAGGYTAFGSELGVFIAKNSPEVNTLAAMKNAKDKLIPFGDERHNQIKDKISKEFLELSDEIRVGSNNRYSFDDSGVARMVELTDHKGNEKEYLKKAYNVEVSDEWMDRYNKLLDTIKKDYKVFYFETKFMRPYGLDEFEKAIVPKDTPKDVVDALKKAGIDVHTYEGKEDREKVTMDAINNSEGIRFMFAGEKGAAEADKAEEKTYRMDNLKVAEKMERGKKDAKAIKLATGWERGADGKWRYEMPDAKIKDMKDIGGGHIVKRYEDDMLWNGGKLSNVIDAPGLFEAYPQLKDVRIDTDDIMNDMPSNGEYNPKTNTITIHADELKYMNSILNHEIQHAIQFIEGFATGGNEDSVRMRIEDRMQNIEDAANVAAGTLDEYRNISTRLVRLELARKWKKNPNSFLKSSAMFSAPGYGPFTPKKEAIEIGQQLADTWIDDAKRFVDSRSERLLTGEDKMDEAKVLAKWKKEWHNKYVDWKDFKEEFDQLDKAIKDLSDYQLYQALAGEVEARNVQNRLGMTDEERRNSLAEETEDVNRDEQIVMNGNDASYSIVKDPETIKKLDKEDTVKVYRAMQVGEDGKLYPPMAAKVKGKFVEPIELGKWEQADERPDLADDKGMFTLNKGNGKSLKAAYNPYLHTSRTPLNDQFSEAQNRPNIVTVEVEVPKSELTSGYKADKAKDAVGEVEWKAGIIQGQLTGKRKVVLSRWDKPVRIVPDSEVADVIVNDMFKGKNITMPSNVVTPSLRKELEKRGVPFVETDNRGRIVGGENDGVHYSKVYGKKANVKYRFGDPYDYEKYPLGRVEPNLATKEVKIVHADANHGFKNYKEAKNWAKQNIAKVYTKEETGEKGEVRISNGAIDKFLSQSAVDKSETKDVHLSVLKVLPQVLKESIDAETHPDFLKGHNGKRSAENGMNKDVLVHRCYGAVDIDGNVYRVKITLKEDLRDKSFPHVTHSYEATKIELLAGTWENPSKSPSPNTNSSQIEPLEAIDAQVQDHGSHSNDSISGTNLLKKVEMSYDKGKKLLDESEKMGISIENQRKIADSVMNTANKLGGAEATVYSSLDDVPEVYRPEVEQGAKGWYDPETHSVHVYLPNCEDGNDAQRTVFHEKIGHEGMEVLLGGEDEVRKFANFVYNSVAASTRGKILEIANEYDPDWKKHDRMNVGTQEYIARLAEEGPKTAEDFSLWTKIKHYLIKVLKKLGIRVPGLLNDKDLRYYLMKAGKALHVWDEMPQEKQEAMMKQASNAEIKDALGDGAGKGKPRQKKGESAIQYMKRVMEWKRWKEAREDENDPEPPMFYDFDKDAEGKKEWERLNKEWRDSHHLQGDEMPIKPERKEGETDEAFFSRYKEWEKWNDAMADKENPMPDMFSFEKAKQDEARQKYEDWLTRHELNEQNDADLDLYEGKIYPAETNPEADALEQRVMQDLAEVTSTDVSKEGAAKTVKHAVIHRRKNMEEASAYDAIYINDVKNRIEKMADSGAFDKLLSDYKGKPNRAEKLAEAIPYIIEAPRRLRDLAHDLNATGAFDKGHIHIQPADVEAIQPYVADLIAETGKKHTVLKDDKEVEVYDDPQAVSEVASKMAQVINANHQGEEGFVPIDGTDILSEHVLPLVKQQIVPEGIDYKNLSPDMKNAVRSIRDWYDYFYDWLKDNRTLREDTGYNADYVNHIWDKEKSDKQAYALYVENRQRTKSPNEKKRTISTLMEGISVGLVPKTTDITKMMAYYSRSNIEAWVNKTMLQELSGLNVIERNEDGEVVSTDPLLSSSAPFNLEQYQYFEIPGVGPVWVYNVSPKQVKVKNPITGKERVLYSEASAGDRFGVVFETYQSSPFWKAFDTLASSAKKLELGFSGFHAGALTEVYMVQNMVEFGPKKAMANFMKYIFADTAKNHELPCFANPQDFQEAATHLVKFGATNDYAAADVQNMFDNMRDAMMKVQEKLKDGNGISGTVALASMPLKVATQMLSLINKGMDRALWDFLHDGLKLATYRMRADKTKERAKKKGWTEEELSRALDEDGQFVNDMFGGQHWDVLGASHRTLRYAGRVLLSPDWNASTTRHFLALTGFGSIWNEATFENFKQYYQRLWHKDLMPEDEGRRSRQISALLCYGIGFMVFYEGIANGINAAFRALDEEKERKKAEEIRKTNPSYKSMYELAYGDEGMKWYDYLMRGNSLGQQSKIFLGRYADGTEMYIRHGKQFREVPEYLFNHKGELEFPGPMVQRMIGKANPMVRMTLDNINYLSDFQASHADQEIQRKYGKTIGLLYKDALYWAPFLIPSQENKEFKAVDFFFPSSKGFSPWKAQSYFKDFILSGDMEGVVMTYQSCQRNGIDAEAQIKAAIGSVKALESAEMNDGVTSLQVACQRFDAAKSITEKKKMRQKMKKFLSQSEYKAFTQKEALDMVQGYLNGDEDLKEMEKAESKYLMVAKAEDVTEDWRIQNAWNGTMEAYQEYQRLKDVDKAKANAFKNSKTNKRLFAARKAISAAKKKMNKAKKQMDGTNGAAKMVEIRKTRKELLNTLNGME